jgi:pilus assembly protein FimV
MLTLLSHKKTIRERFVRTFSLGKALAVALLLLTPWMAHAAGLGRLTVQSSLGQPLSAEIDLVAVRGDEASTLTVRLASPDAYQQANLQYNAGVTGLKLSIERRPNGQSYIKVTGSRPLNEPFVDLLIELSWSGGRIVREYTALLDPPGYGQQAQALAAPAATPAVPISKPIAAAPVAPAPTPAAAAPRAQAQEYGPIAKGETLGKIAASLKPQGVSLEQMLVGLYRSNPDAFIRNNLNLVRSGRILRVPDAQELAAIPQGEAIKEYRAQVADWRAYSSRIADAAGQAPEGGSTARGRIVAKVDDPAAESRDVVKLSKGEPGKGGAALTGEAKARALQEELIARTKELAEANERIAQLEKTIKDSQKLAELKSPGLAAAQQKAEAAKADASKAAKPEPVKPEGAKPAEPAIAAKDAAAKSEMPAAKPEEKAPAADAASAAEKPAEEAKPAPKPQPKPVIAPPPPPPEPEMMDVVMENLPLIGGGLGVLVLGGLGIAAMRRRRARAASDDIEAVAPTLAAAAAGGAAAVAADSAETAVAATPAAAATDEVDPVQEAEVYIAYGRDGQAEEILKDAMARDPSREDVQLKLAEVYSARKDAASFATVAESMNSLTGGSGDNWIKMAAMGYALDPSNPLYAAGKDVAPVVDASDSATSTDLDFDLGGDSGSVPDIALDADPTTAAQPVDFGGTVQMAAPAETAVEPVATEFNLDLPPAGAQTDIALEAPASADSGSIDFNIELPAIDVPAAGSSAEPAAEAPAPATDGGLDFKIDVGDLNINLDDPSTTATPAAEKDSHWYDVQQKFDLAKAYQEMGDNDGAKEILQEVLKEGDAEQKDQAHKLLSSLG